MPRSLFVFNLLVVYIFIQFCWWAYLMVDLNREIHTLKTVLLIRETPDEAIYKIHKEELDAKLRKKMWMIGGESSVFLLFLCAGVIITQQSFRKETALARQQKNFLLSVTHELKSPISSARLYLQTLQKRELPREKQLEMMENAIHDTDRLSALVDKLLLATRIDNSSFLLNKEKTDLSAFVKETIGKATTWISKDREVNLEIEPDITASIDRLAFGSILLNLFENAVKYSPAGTNINIRLSKQQNKAVFSIADEGVGISNPEKKKIFDKFYRIGNEETRKSKGTGLGLYIVKYFVKQHNGTVRVRDNAPHGSVFEVEI